MGIYFFLQWYFHGDTTKPPEEWPLRCSSRDPAGNWRFIPSHLGTVYNNLPGSHKNFDKGEL